MCISTKPLLGLLRFLRKTLRDLYLILSVLRLLYAAISGIIKMKRFIFIKERAIENTTSENPTNGNPTSETTKGYFD